MAVLGKQDAYELGAVGPTARGSGSASISARPVTRLRKDQFQTCSRTVGDCYGRCAVRAKEMFTSIDIIEQCVKKIPDGPVDVKVTGAPDGEYFSRPSSPGAKSIHYIKGNGKKNLVRHRVRTPTFTNIPPLVSFLKGCELADVPVIVLSIDPCVGCAER